MAGPVTSEVQAEPNLTPLLDVVFQLITFFMLVTNFSAENYDQKIRLPMASSARPVEDTQRVSEDRLVINVDREGHLVMAGEVLPLHQSTATIKHQADLIRLNLKAAGLKPDPSGGLPTTIVFRADVDTNFSSIIGVITTCQNSGFRKFALKALDR